MPRVLIVSTIAPFCWTAGMRLGSFIQYFPDHGLEPVVLQLRGCSPEQPVHPKLAATGAELHGFDGLSPNARKGFWVRVENKLKLPMALYGQIPFDVGARAKRVITEIMTSNPADIIIGSYSTPLSHGLANWASRRFGVPWIADFRDIIDQLDFGPLNPMVYAMEKRTVSSAARLTTVSEGLANRLRERYEQPVEVVYNGYFADDYTEITPHRFDKFTVLYTGLIYEGRDPRPLMRAAAELVAEGEVAPGTMDLAFYGAGDEVLGPYARETGAEDLVSLHGKIGHDEVVELQAGAHLLLLLPGSLTNIDGILTGKLFEYMATRRPVLSIDREDTSNREVITTIERTKAGKALHDVASIKAYLLDLYTQWKATGEVTPLTGDDSYTEFRRDNQAMKMASVVKDVLASR